MDFAAFTFITVNPTEGANENSSDEHNSSKPEPLTQHQKKDARNARERKWRAAKKWKAEAESGTRLAIESSAGEEDEEPAKKKKKKLRGQKKAAKSIELSEEDDVLPKRFTVYFDIEGLKSATASSSHAKNVPLPLVIKKGPFFHNTNNSFTMFKNTIAALTPCNPDLLVLTNITWKFDTPTNGVCRLMSNKIGYEAMLTAVRAKKGESVVFMYMPPPKKDIVRQLSTIVIYVLTFLVGLAHR